VPSDQRQPAPAYPPAFVDLRGLCYTLSLSNRQAARLLSAGRLPAADCNLGSGAKGRRWNREKLLTAIQGGLRQ